MLSSNQPLHQHEEQKFTKALFDELQTAYQTLPQENPQTPNPMAFEFGDQIPFEFGSSSESPQFRTIVDHGVIEKYFSGGDLGDDWWKTWPERQDALAINGNALLMPMAEKDPKVFVIVGSTEAHKGVTVASLGVIDVTGSIPDDPAQKQAFLRALVFKSGFLIQGKSILKLCTTGGGGFFLGDQGLDPMANSVVHSPGIKMLLSSTRERSLTDLIGQVQADCAKELGKEAEDVFKKMVEYTPREVIANFYSVELWDMLTLEDKVKEEFAKLQLCRRPEIIDSPPAAFLNHPVPASDFKPSRSTAHEGVVKCFLVPDLNETYLEDEPGEGTVVFANGEKEKANSKKRKAEATGGEEQDHVFKMPTFPANP